MHVNFNFWLCFDLETSKKSKCTTNTAHQPCHIAFQSLNLFDLKIHLTTKAHNKLQLLKFEHHKNIFSSGNHKKSHLRNMSEKNLLHLSTASYFSYDENHHHSSFTTQNEIVLIAKKLAKLKCQIYYENFAFTD
jgi:hypothetical protein